MTAARLVVAAAVLAGAQTSDLLPQYDGQLHCLLGPRVLVLPEHDALLTRKVDVFLRMRARGLLLVVGPLQSEWHAPTVRRQLVVVQLRLRHDVVLREHV